jgi:hypothetical protein
MLVEAREDRTAKRECEQNLCEGEGQLKLTKMQ